MAVSVTITSGKTQNTGGAPDRSGAPDGKELLPGYCLSYFSFCLVLVLCLAGMDCCLIWARYALRRPSTEGRSGVILVVPLSLDIEELIFVTCESRPDRKSFFGGPA